MQIKKQIKLTLKNLLTLKNEFEKENDMEAIKECNLNISLFDKVSSLFKSKELKIYGIVRGTPTMEYYLYLSDTDLSLEKELKKIFSGYGILANFQNN